MSKKLYVGLYASTIIATILFIILTLIAGVIGANFNMKDEIAPVTAILLGLTLLSFLAWAIIHTVYNFLLLAKMWGAIQDGYTEISVGKAIGFLFIPFFSIYWIFKVWGGFPTEYNRYIERHNLAVPPLSSGVFVAFPIVVLLSAIYIGLIALPFVMIAVTMKVCDAVNALENASLAKNNNFYYPPPPQQFQ